MLARDCASCLVTEEFGQRILTSTPALEAALQASEAAGLPSIQVPPSQGKLLQLLALAQGPRRILEVGTLGGFSTPAAEGARRMAEWIRREPRLSATVIQTVGAKGYDGLLLARVQAGP